MKSSLSTIKHYIEYILFSLICFILRLFSIEDASRYCSIIARKLGPYFPVTKIARKNLHLAYADITRSEEDKIINDLWDNFGRFLGEFPHIHSLNDNQVNKYVKIIGQENIEHLRKENKPFLLCTGHFANWDLALRILKYLYPKFSIIYRKANNRFVNNVINKWRKTDNMGLIEKGTNGSRSLIRAIKDRNSIVMLVDQKMNDGIKVPFFGHIAMTAPAIAKIALQYDYQIVPVELVRTNGCNIEVIVHPPLAIDRTRDEQEEIVNIMSTINQILESWVRKRPGQWFWFHKRWKKYSL